LRKKDKHTQIWITKEPTDTTQAGKKIIKKLHDGGFSTAQEALQLFVQDRIEQTIFRKQILKHSTILSSRFDYSTYVYQ
jgi:thymidylate kinase